MIYLDILITYLDWEFENYSDNCENTVRICS
jgi:hypothetical protein